MKKILFVLGLLSVNALAASPDFSQLANEDGGHGSKLDQCIHRAWDSAGTSDSQNAQAHEFVLAAKAVFEQNKDGIHSGMRTLFAAWSKAPIVREEVMAGEGALHTALSPVMSAVRDARINVINLLTPTQRDRFDTVLKRCMHRGR